MDESIPSQAPVNLHTIPSLKDIHIRNGIKLRPLAIEDGPIILDILTSDPSIRERVTVASRLHTEGDVRKEVEKSNADPGLIRYALLENDSPIGLVSLWRDNGFFGDVIDQDAYGFGYFLDPQQRGRGLITDAVHKLMEVASNSLIVSQFMAFSEDDNIASTAILKKLGFTPTDQTFPEPNNGWLERKYIKYI